MFPADPPVHPKVAYFCMEFGLDARFTVYAGGLGILAGDHMKSAGDLKLPIVGIGLLWNEGYVEQRLDHGQPVDRYPPTDRTFLEPVPLPPGALEVTVRGQKVPLRAFRVTRFVEGELYLLEPERDEDRWITARLYGGGSDDRLAQEIVLGVGGVRLLHALDKDADVHHFNEGHAVFAGLELLRTNRYGGNKLRERIERLRPHVVFTTHTPVAAGNEIHELSAMRRMGSDLGFTDAELTQIGGDPFSMTVAGLRFARIANAVAQLHGETARRMWTGVAGAAPIIAITNGVHAATWQDPRIRAALAPGKSDDERGHAIWNAHRTMHAELAALVKARTGAVLDPGKLTIGFARRAAGYKRADLILGDDARLARILERAQIVYSGKAHPRDHGGKALVARLAEAARRWPGQVVFLENYDMAVGAAMTRGADVWLNNPRRPLEASGTSGMKAAMNGVLNVSILDGWWPEGCEHGVTGWKIGDPEPGDDSLDESHAAAVDIRDRERLYQVLEQEVLPIFYDDRARWVRMMEASVAMSAWRFSSDRMVEEYFARVYARSSSSIG